MESQGEIWKSHPDISGIEVSTLGRVRTLDRVVSSERGKQFVKGRVLKQFNNGRGYLRVHFRINGKQMNKFVHRLVTQTFIPNHNGLPMVNHKDGNRANNHIDNLEWCTASYNSKYREEFGKALSNPVYAINLSTLEVLQFSSQHEASRTIGVSQGNISNVIKGRHKYTHGYWFATADDNAVNLTKQKLREIGETRLTAADTESANFVRQVLAG